MGAVVLRKLYEVIQPLLTIYPYDRQRMTLHPLFNFVLAPLLPSHLFGAQIPLKEAAAVAA